MSREPRRLAARLFLITGWLVLVWPGLSAAADRETLKPRAGDSAPPIRVTFRESVRRIQADHDAGVRELRSAMRAASDGRTRLELQREIETLHLAQEVRLLELQRARALVDGDDVRRRRLDAALSRLPAGAHRLAASPLRGGDR